MRAILFLMAFAAGASAQTISFLPATGVASAGAHVVDSCIGCVAVADFNNDGKPDIVYSIVTAPAPQVGVLLGNGDGTFRPVPAIFSAGGSLLVGDFNGDGKPDLVFAGYATEVYLGKGDGTFGAPINVTACFGTSSYVSIQVGDFNRDGRTDILCGTSLLLSNGDGSFRAAGTAGAVAMESAMLVADFNGDGIPDVLLHQISGILVVVLGRGDGTFSAELPIGYGVRPNSPYNGFLAEDFNGDGKVDLLTVSERDQFIDFLPGKGDGTFGSLVETNLNGNPPPLAMTAVGDFNKDGKLDFISGDAVYAGNGDGTFRFPVFFGPTASACGAALNPTVSYSCNYSHDSTAAGDFNGDGLPDIVVGVVNHYGTGQISDVGEVNVLLNDSPGNGFTASGVSAATYVWPVGPGSFVSAFGVNLAPSTAVAATNPAPTTLGGIRLHVRDRSHAGDALAPLLYVSPTQINYVLNSSDPYAWVDIERVGSPYVPQGMTVPITPIAPGFFSAAYTAAAPGYLSLYGTGFAQASTSASSCSVGAVAVQVTYAGPEIQIAGLDQVNLFLPGSLAGAGVQPVTCTFDGGITNTVNVTVR